MTPRTPTSEVLEALLTNPLEGRATLAWMMDRLGDRSFGVVLLLLAILGLLPGVSPVVAVLLLVPAVQMIRGNHRPVFPRSVADRAFETRKLERLIRRVVPVLRWLERFIQPRWGTPFQATKRVVGGVIIVLAIGLLTPVPLSNVPIALMIGLIAFAYLEEDGVLLCAALAVTFIMLAAAAVVAWETLGAMGLARSML
ncbi:exopolysaccharide biosynthesis protein [Neoroseomonas alba]|nr:exopolysaccharide biosynthesis protein [Neoroseomonas alba]